LANKNGGNLVAGGKEGKGGAFRDWGGGLGYAGMRRKAGGGLGGLRSNDESGHLGGWETIHIRG